VILQLPLADPFFPIASIRLPIVDSRRFFIIGYCCHSLISPVTASAVFFPVPTYQSIIQSASLPNRSCLVVLPGASATEFRCTLVRPNVGSTASCAMRPILATAKSVLFVREQPKQNLSDLGGFFGKLLKTFHGFQFQIGNGDEKGRWGISRR
jgi:hypothetical protein